MEKEKRTYKLSNLEIRGEGEKRTITGHAAVFDVIGDGGWFREKIAPGAFEEAIGTDDVRALINHDSNLVLGRNKAGTLRMWEDEKGLAIEVKPPDTQAARDLITSMQRGDIDQMSFAFVPQEVRWEYDEDNPDNDLRILERVKLYDVSVVTYPFYEATDASVRSSHTEQKPKHNIKKMRRKLKLNERKLKERM